MKNKIRVLLIDDYPSFALTKAAHTTLDNLRDNQKELEVPFISSKVDTTGKLEDDNSNSMSPINVRINNVAEEEYSEYFELKWLRNKEDLQLYKKLCRITEDQFSSSGLGRIDGVVPEIVLFDYALTGHEDKSYLDEESDMNLLTQIVPIYRIKEFLLDEKKEIPTADNVSLDVSLIADGLNSDNIGCMGGIMTVSHFRNHLCVGLATSRKSDEHIQGQDVQFLESLVKEPHQFNFRLRGNIKNLTWKTLLSNSALLLRNRIKTLIQSNKITLDLNQLLQYAGGDIKIKHEERIFTFQSVYGVRHLPLDGLFIDVPENDRDEAIKNWAGELIENFEWEDYKIASEKSKTLLDAYKGEVFEHRMKLSELAVRLCNNEDLNEDAWSKLDNLISEFGVVINKDEPIPEQIAKANLSNKVIDFRNETENFSPQQKRLVVLFTDLRLHLAWQKFKTKNQNSTYNPDILNLLISPPTLSELRAVLFPVAKNPLILDYHRKLLIDDSFLNKNIFEAWEKPIGEHLKSDKIFSKTEFPVNLKDGEIRLAKSFALKSDLRKEFFPDWLKK